MPSSLDAVIKNVLEKKIGEKVWKILKDHIEKDVYDAYKPNGRWVWGTAQDDEVNGYQRRREKGLLNEAGKYIFVDRDGDLWGLRVSTKARPSESVLGYKWTHHTGGFLALLEKGDLGFWSRSGNSVTHPFPRPVITNAQDEAMSHMPEYEAEIYAAINKAIS